MKGKTDVSELASAIRKLGFVFNDEALHKFSPASIKLIEKTRNEGPRALQTLCWLLMKNKLFDATEHILEA